MLAGIEFGLLHLFPHRVNAFKDMVYFSNGETLFSETFIRFLPIPLSSLSRKIGLYGVGVKTRGPSLSGKVSEPKAVGASQAKVIQCLLSLLLLNIRTAVLIGTKRKSGSCSGCHLLPTH